MQIVADVHLPEVSASGDSTAWPCRADVRPGCRFWLDGSGLFMLLLCCYWLRHPLLEPRFLPPCLLSGVGDVELLKLLLTLLCDVELQLDDIAPVLALSDWFVDQGCYMLRNFDENGSFGWLFTWKSHLLLLKDDALDANAVLTLLRLHGVAEKAHGWLEDPFGRNPEAGGVLPLPVSVADVGMVQNPVATMRQLL
ncbi:hypothetical protein Nepgr_003975 [Nepenthes gracilis]|uniref:Uncharacterized protein n=1 Tax=Nepenthes gracilis TaxID=150966 RepID=A0AAD3S0Q9_NEPGR|nr:hypothetical protein Nepgr_003975 [Nepenthes gracilis]